MAGIEDLATILEGLEVLRRPGTYVFARSSEPIVDASVEAIIREDEGFTLVMTREAAESNGLSFDFEAAWLTLAVHSSLAAVGLTATVAGALAELDIPCNVIAGFYHDHLLVPVARAEEAIRGIEAVKRYGPSGT